MRELMRERRSRSSSSVVVESLMDMTLILREEEE